MSEHHSPIPAKRSSGAVIGTIALLIVGYVVAISLGWIHHADEHHEESASAMPHLWSALPFVALLGAVAILPLIPSAAHWWEHNLNKFYVAVSLALLTLGYVAVLHPAASTDRAWHNFTHTMLGEYVPFIVLLFSLYTISGGIRIAGDLPAHSLTNMTFMLIGGLLASFIGTTGAAMLLIRPLLETNGQRKHVAHTVVFFIFIVCNCGGLLLPIGDPPLFLGYLNGVDFFWTLSLWPSWLFVNGMLLGVYFLWDHFYSYPKETVRDIATDETRVHALRFSGIKLNLPLLFGVILAVALLDPGKTLPGTDWHPWPFMREIVMLFLVLVSLLGGSQQVRNANSFDYVPIVEVAVLFIGIFLTMGPALEIVKARGAELGLNSPQKFFWVSGSLSAVLDNAPTYLVFFKVAQVETAQNWADAPQMAGVAVSLLIGISLGSVCMGAMTYIGNGPNFMVKSIAEKSGVQMPSFLGYIVYSVCILLPILAANAWLFI